MPAIAEITFTLAAWVGLAAAALLVAIAAVALLRQKLIAGLAVVAVIGLGAWATHALSVSTRDGERRSLEGRLAALETAAWAPASPLSCLGAAVGDALESACERTLFASPETIAAAASFTQARFALLREAMDFVARQPSFEGALTELRSAIEQDRYGFAAHVLEQRFACTVDACALVRLLRDGSRVRANLREGVFEQKLSTHRNDLNGAPPSPPAEPKAPPPAAVSGLKHTPLPSTFMLPSSESIPPVSIMDNEPSPATTGTTPAAPQPGAPAVPPPSAQSRAPTHQTSRTTAPAPPMQLVPPDRRP